MHSQDVATHQKTAWNKGKLVGQKAPLKIRDIWAIRIRLQLHGETRNLALFNLAVDSKLRGCDLVRLRVPLVWKAVYRENLPPSSTPMSPATAA